MEQDLIRNLGPSPFSAEGFLGSDSRPVDEIIGEDLAVLEQNQVPAEAVAEALAHGYEKAKGDFGAKVPIRPGLTAVFHESRGRVPCPFRGDGLFDKGEAVVKDAQNGHTLIITPLGIHLIAKYGFFQGKGSRYRIEPRAVIEMFRLSSS
jgi:hypothetical protein